MNQACNDRNLFFSVYGEGVEVNKYYVDDAMITSADTGDFLSIVSRCIKEGACVLDVGCAQGKLGRKLVDKKCKLIGVDVNKASIEYVQKRGYYTDAFLCDITQSTQEAFRRVRSYGPYDHIVLTDILEHLVDPTWTLLELRKILKEDGSFLVSVPNVANSDICLNLLNSHFNYGSMGILDNTHVKFFTRSSFQQWIELINSVYPDQKLFCTYLGATYYTSEYVRSIEKKYPQLARVLAARPESEAFQLLFTLRKNFVADVVQHETDFDCVAALGELLENRLDILPNAPMLESERETFKKMLMDKDSWIAEQDRMLQETRQTGSASEAQIVSQQNLIEQLTQINAEKDEKIRWCEQVDKSKDEAIVAKDEWIKTQQEQVEYLIRVSEEKDEHIRQCEQVMQSKDEAIAAKDEWIASQQEQVDYLSRVSEEKDEHIRQCEQVMQSKDEAIATKDEWIASQQEQVDYLSRVNEEKDEHIRQCEQVMQSKDEAIAAKDEWIASQQEQVDYLSRVSEEKDEHIRQCEQVMQSKDEAIAAKDEWIASQQEQVEYLSRVSKGKDERIAEQTKQTEFLQKELDEKEGKLQNSIRECKEAQMELLKLRQRMLDIESTWIWRHSKFMHKGL